jgi:hypothetical protein
LSAGDGFLVTGVGVFHVEHFEEHVGGDPLCLRWCDHCPTRALFNGIILEDISTLARLIKKYSHFLLSWFQQEVGFSAVGLG